MRINELEQQTGLDRATIRYYEKEGFITPTRLENGYRDYSQDDKLHLQKIKLLRQLGMPLENIHAIQEGRGDIQDALTEQVQLMCHMRDASQRSIQICEKMKEDGVTYTNMDAEYYLDQLQRIPISFPLSKAQARAEKFRELFARPRYPRRRFLARWIDVSILSTIILFVQAVVFRLGIHTITLPNVVVVLLLVPIEAMCYHYFGTTIGKWVMGIRVECSDGCKHGLHLAFNRAWRVYRDGVGYGIPLWGIWRMYQSYTEYDEFAELPWDDESKLTFKEWDWKRTTALITILTCILCMNIASNYEKQLPKYRNTTINVKQFAQTYNYYRDYLGYDAVYEKKGSTPYFSARSDGTMYTPDNNTVSIEYICKDDKVVSVIILEENIDFTFYSKPWYLFVFAVTMVSTQENQDNHTLLSLKSDLEHLVNEALETGTNYFYEERSGVIIEWEIKYENAVVSGGSTNKSLYSRDGIGHAITTMKISYVE